MPVKAGQPNKSQAIRDMLAGNPQIPSKEVVSTLRKQGIKVSAHLVYFVKSQLKHKKRKQKRLQAVEASRTMGVTNPVELVLHVKRLATDAGGIRKLKQLVDALAE
jgi:hypothetical protein